MSNPENHCKDCCCTQSWNALGITEYAGRSIPEEIERLKRDHERLIKSINNPINDGGPAFPCSVTGFQPETGTQVVREQYYGLTMRDWFAGMALQGILAANAKNSDEVTDKNVDYVVAREAYRSADAMIEMRKL